MITNNNNTRYSKSIINCNWADLSANSFTVRTIPARLRGGQLPISFTNLEPNATYRWMIKNQVQDADNNGIDFATFVLSPAQTTQSIAPALVRTAYGRTLDLDANNKYIFVLQKQGEGSEYRFDFQIFDDGVHEDGGSLIRQFSSSQFTLSGNDIDSNTNKVLDQQSLELGNITVFSNLRIPTNLAVKTLVDGLIATSSSLALKIASNLSDLANFTTARTNLNVYSIPQVDTALGLKQNLLTFTPENLANKNINNGYAGLDAGGKINPSQIPSIALGETFVVASQVAMLALTAQIGDVAIRTDLSNTFILTINDPTILANWQVILTPTDLVQSVYGRNGVVTAQSGDYNTSLVPENTNLYFTEGRVRSAVLTGLSTTNNIPIIASNTALVALGNLQAQITANIANTASLDAQNVKITGNQTIAGTKTFSAPVVGVNPTANNHLVTRSSLDPSNLVYNQLETVRSRFITAGLVWDDLKFYYLRNLYFRILAITQVLPDILLLPLMSADLTAPGSTRLINLGTLASVINIADSTVGGMINQAEGVFDTSALSGTERITTDIPNYTNNFTLFSKTQKFNTANQFLWSSGNVSNSVRFFFGNFTKIIYDIQGVATVVTSTPVYTTTAQNLVAVGQAGGQAFSQIINPTTNARDQLANATLATNNSNIILLSHGAVSHYRGRTRVIGSFNRLLTTFELSMLNDIF